MSPIHLKNSPNLYSWCTQLIQSRCCHAHIHQSMQIQTEAPAAYCYKCLRHSCIGVRLQVTQLHNCSQCNIKCTNEPFKSLSVCQQTGIPGRHHQAKCIQLTTLSWSVFLCITLCSQLFHVQLWLPSIYKRELHRQPLLHLKDAMSKCMYRIIVVGCLVLGFTQGIYKLHVTTHLQSVAIKSFMQMVGHVITIAHFHSHCAVCRSKRRDSGTQSMGTVQLYSPL